jgi:hypothetical protein
MQWIKGTVFDLKLLTVVIRLEKMLEMRTISISMIFMKRRVMRKICQEVLRYKKLKSPTR